MIPLAVCDLIYICPSRPLLVQAVSRLAIAKTWMSAGIIVLVVGLLEVTCNVLQPEVDQCLGWMAPHRCTHFKVCE